MTTKLAHHVVTFLFSKGEKNVTSQNIEVADPKEVIPKNQPKSINVLNKFRVLDISSSFNSTLVFVLQCFK